MDWDQWRATATWDGGNITYGQAWNCLQDPTLPEAFRTAIAERSLTHAGLRKARQQAGGLNVGGTPLVVEAPRNRFLNLVSGRFTELLFERAYTDRLSAVGVTVGDVVGERNWVDFDLRADDPPGWHVPVNTKNAGMQFRKAQSFAGLDPEDCIPVAAYKAFAGGGGQDPHLLYVFLIDWGLIERLRDAFVDALSPAELLAFRLLACGKDLSMDAEDAFITATIQTRIDDLAVAVGYDLPGGFEPNFRAVSAAKVRNVLYADQQRTPGVYRRQPIRTEPAVHISITDETVPFGEVIDRWMSSPARRAELVAGLTATGSMPIPTPVL